MHEGIFYFPSACLQTPPENHFMGVYLMQRGLECANNRLRFRQLSFIRFDDFF